MAISQPTESFIPASATTQAFTLQNDHTLFTVLRKNIYSDTILAPIRELSTNACDACIEAGLPIVWEAHIPTLEEPFFSVRDFGPGITLEFLEGNFTVVGSSTKRDSNLTNGSFGMGRLSPLAYTSSFTVESFNNGMHYSYLVSLSEGIPCTVQLAAVPSDEPSGARFSFAVDPMDIAKFHRKAADLYKYFDVPPTTNIQLETPKITLNHDNFMLTEDALGIVMGNVYYKLDWSHVRSNYDSLILKVPIGKVALTPGRESLNYDQATIDYLKSYILEAEEELLDISNTHIQSQPTDYLKMMAYVDIEKKTPYSVRDKLVVPSSTLCFVDFRDNCPISSPLFTVQYKHPSYKVLRNPSSLYVGAGWFFNATFFIADQRTYLPAVHSLDEPRMVIFKPVDLSPAGIQAVTDFLDTFGITDYTLASSVNAEPRDKPARKPVQVLVRPFRNGYTDNPETYIESSSTMYYVPLDGNSLQCGLSKPFIHTLFLEHFPDTPFYAIAQTHIPKVKKSPNFVNFLDYLRDTYDESNPLLIEYTKSEDFQEYRRIYNHSHERIFKCATTPSFIPLAIQNYQHLQVNPFRDLTQSDQDKIAAIVPTIFKFLRPTITLKNLYDRYPLLSDVNNLSVEQLTHYFMLEEHYAPALHPPR